MKANNETYRLQVKVRDDFRASEVDIDEEFEEILRETGYSMTFTGSKVKVTIQAIKNENKSVTKKFGEAARN